MTEKTEKGYRYVPEIGKRVHLREWADYTVCNMAPWLWLEVLSRDGDTLTLEHINGTEHTGMTVTVLIDRIALPIGWRERYTIHVAPDKLADILTWLTRGIVVRQSHYLERAGDTCYQPMDNADVPRWQYPEVTDVVTPDQTTDRISIVKLETWIDVWVPVPCTYCNGTGIRKAQACHIGNPNITPTPQAIGDSIACWTCDKGTVHGYLTGIKDRKAKAAAKDSLKRQGWDLRYINHGGEGSMYIAKRETVVKPFGRVYRVVDGTEVMPEVHQ